MYLVKKKKKIACTNLERKKIKKWAYFDAITIKKKIIGFYSVTKSSQQYCSWNPFGYTTTSISIPSIWRPTDILDYQHVVWTIAHRLRLHKLFYQASAEWTDLQEAQVQAKDRTQPIPTCSANILACLITAPEHNKNLHKINN